MRFVSEAKLTRADVTGELVRSDITESQPGVPLHLDIQVIDTNTCAPLSGVALDFWHCNATGVYSGIVANGNGNSADQSNLNATFLRGIQSTDSDGLAAFSTIVPGHYTGRTTHIHVLAHAPGQWSLQANNTITGGATAAHVGQIFFDQDLLTEVYKLSPYSTSTQSLTTNADDSIMAQEAAGVDPVIEYVLLGESLSDGLFGWIAVGINGTASKSVQAAATDGVGGGVANSGGGRGGGGGGGPGGAPPGSSGASNSAAGASNAASGASGASAAAASATGSTSGAKGTTAGTCRARSPV